MNSIFFRLSVTISQEEYVWDGKNPRLESDMTFFFQREIIRLKKIVYL